MLVRSEVLGQETLSPENAERLLKCCDAYKSQYFVTDRTSKRQQADELGEKVETSFKRDAERIVLLGKLVFVKPRIRVDAQAEASSSAPPPEKDNLHKRLESGDRIIQALAAMKSDLPTTGRGRSASDASKTVSLEKKAPRKKSKGEAETSPTPPRASSSEQTTKSEKISRKKPVSDEKPPKTRKRAKSDAPTLEETTQNAKKSIKTSKESGRKRANTAIDEDQRTTAERVQEQLDFGFTAFAHISQKPRKRANTTDTSASSSSYVTSEQKRRNGSAESSTPSQHNGGDDWVTKREKRKEQQSGKKTGRG